MAMSLFFINAFLYLARYMNKTAQNSFAYFTFYRVKR